MPDKLSVASSERWAITEKGRYDLLFCQLCQCDPRLRGLVVQCDGCGTVYGHLGELDAPKRAFKRRSR